LKVALLYSLAFLGLTLSALGQTVNGGMQQPILSDTSSLEKSSRPVFESKKLIDLSFGNAKITKYDSLRHSEGSSSDTLRQNADSLKLEAREKIDSINSYVKNINTKLDSLIKPSVVYSRVDSMQSAFGQGIGKVNGAGTQITDSLKNLENKANAKLREFNNAFDKLGAHKLPEVKMPDTNTNALSDVSRMSGTLRSDLKIPVEKSILPGEITTIPNVSTNQLPALKIPSTMKLPNEVGQVTKQAGNVSTVTGELNNVEKQASSYTGELNQIKQEGLEKSEKLPEMTEHELTKIDEINALKGTEMNAVQKQEEYKNLIEQYKNEQAIRAELEEKMKHVANDVLDRYQGVIAKDMKKLSLKKRISQWSDLKSVFGNKANSMKAASWRERIVPGIVCQTLSGHSMTWVQTDPQVTYKLNTNWGVGVGGMYRFSVKSDLSRVGNSGSMQGGNFFIQRFMWNGIFVRAEAQYFSWKPIWNIHPTDPPVFNRVCVVEAGVGKSYMISKKLRGNTQALYHWTYKGADPYVSKIVIRFGLNFSLVKQQTPIWKKQLWAIKHCTP
jgi:hypothetical protein